MNLLLQNRKFINSIKVFSSLNFLGWDKLAFPAWPLDLTVERLLEAVLLLCMKSSGIDAMPFIWFWPDGAPSAAILTHDVETAQGRDFCPRLMDINESFGFRASFQIVPEERYAVTTAFLKEIRDRGHEINVQDLNHDGKLSAEECGFQARGPMAEHADQLARGRLSFMQLHPVLAALDSNHDGVISADEIRKARASLRTLDQNGDGVLTESELKPDPVRMLAFGMLAQYDANNDGKISRDEFETTATPPWQFDGMDANHDGFVTTDEIIAFFKSQGTLSRLLAK